MAPPSLPRLALAGLTVLLVLAAPPTAQTPEQDRLKGITDVQILIEDPNADDVRCGISEGLLNAAVTKALLDNGIRIRNEALFIPYLYVNTTTLYFDNTDQCVTNLRVELYVSLNATPSHSPTEVFGRFDLAHRAVIRSSVRSAHGQGVKDDVFGFVEEIALAIRVANQ